MYNLLNKKIAALQCEVDNLQAELAGITDPDCNCNFQDINSIVAALEAITVEEDKLSYNALTDLPDLAAAQSIPTDTDYATGNPLVIGVIGHVTHFGNVPAITGSAGYYTVTSGTDSYWTQFYMEHADDGLNNPTDGGALEIDFNSSPQRPQTSNLELIDRTTGRIIKDPQAEYGITIVKSFSGGLPNTIRWNITGLGSLIFGLLFTR